MRRFLCAAAGAVMIVAGPALAQHADQLPPDMRRALIVAIQEELQDHNYPVGSADGVFGGRTRSAITQYQREAGLAVDGQPTKELLDHLKFAKPATYRGRTGPQPGDPGRFAASPRAPIANDLVSSVQRELKVRGYYTGEIDGAAGPGTQGAVRAFQRDAGFPVTGDVDQRLLGELRAVDPKISAGGRR